MKMPLRAFWALNAQISRIRSEEFLENIDLMFVANMNCDGETIEKIRKTHIDRLGEPAVVQKAVTFDRLQLAKQSAREHEEGIGRLKQLQNR